MSSVYYYPLMVVLVSLLGVYLCFRYYLHYHSRTYSGIGDPEDNRRLMKQAQVLMLVSSLIFIISLIFLFDLSKNPVTPASKSTLDPAQGTGTITLGSPTPPIVPLMPALTPSPQISPTVGAGFARIGNTNGFGANVRIEPGLNNESLIQLSDGSRVELTGEAQEADGFNWQRVRLEDGRLGWIADKFLIPEG